MSIDEGYIKFDSDWTAGSAADPELTALLDRWRRPLFDAGLIGHYDEIGVGYAAVLVSFPAAVAHWPRTLAHELGPLGITVNSVLPVYTATARLEELAESPGARGFFGNAQTPIMAIPDLFLFGAVFSLFAPIADLVHQVSQQRPAHPAGSAEATALVGKEVREVARHLEHVARLVENHEGPGGRQVLARIADEVDPQVAAMVEALSDSLVDTTDILLARNNQTNFLNALKLIDLSLLAESPPATSPAWSPPAAPRPGPCPRRASASSSSTTNLSSITSARTPE